MNYTETENKNILELGPIADLTWRHLRLNHGEAEREELSSLTELSAEKREGLPEGAKVTALSFAEAT